MATSCRVSFLFHSVCFLLRSLSSIFLPLISFSFFKVDIFLYLYISIFLGKFGGIQQEQNLHGRYFVPFVKFLILKGYLKYLWRYSTFVNVIFLRCFSLVYSASSFPFVSFYTSYPLITFPLFSFRMTSI